MANTSSRTLKLLSLLQTHRYWPGMELAGRLEISVRTLRRDVDRLRALGYPVEAQRGIDGGYQLAAGAAMPPLLLDDEEAVALAIGLRAAAQASVVGIEDSSIRALAKLVQVMPPRLRRRVDAFREATVPAVWSSGPTVDAGALVIVAQACRDEERLRFTYTAQNGDQSSRHVEPYRPVSLGRRWYLVAYDLHRQDWRSFRLDRLAAPRNTGMRFRPRELPAKDAAAFVRAGIQSQQMTHKIEVVVEAAAETVRKAVGPWGTVDELGSDRARLRMQADSFDWPAHVLGMLGVDFEIVAPPELRAYLSDWASRFHKATTA
jgi:predicted DNA-binding transcriptional regulator YafY